MAKKRTERQKLIDRLDELWRIVDVQTQVCEVCETLPPELRFDYSKIDNHHIVGRGNKLLRWDTRNRARLCTGHHTLSSKNAQENQGGWFFNDFTDEDWMGTYRLEDKKYLMERRYQTKNWSIFELRELLSKMKEKLKNPDADEYSDSIVSFLS